MKDDELTFYPVSGWSLRRGPRDSILLILETPVRNAQGRQASLPLPPLMLDRRQAGLLATDLWKNLQPDGTGKPGKT